MKALTAQPGLLASKFDRLSSKYDQWTVGNGCTYYGWLARAARAAPEGLRGPDATIIDVACGIGLPGQMLRRFACNIAVFHMHRTRATCAVHMKRRSVSNAHERA